MKRKRVLIALDWYDPELHRGIAAYSMEHDWVLNTHMVRTNLLPEGWEGDGVIGLMSHPRTLAFVNALNLPTVDMGGHSTGFPQVLSDNYLAGSMAAGHFLERNHRNFAFFFIQCSRLEKEVSSGFLQTLESAGQTCQLHYWKATDFEHEVNYRTVHNWAKVTLAALPKPVAVMCQNDDTMAIILNAALDAGIHVPEEVALLGLGNSSLVCDFLRVKLSSIDVDLAGFAYRAAQELNRLFQGGTPQVIPIRVPPKGVVLRESTNFLAVSDSHAKGALRQIWHHYSKPLSVGKIIEAAPVSRSNLYKRFIQEVGRPIGRELLRVRLDHAERLLSTTDKSIEVISKECGFPSGISFSNTFARKFKLRPGKFRSKQCGKNGKYSDLVDENPSIVSGHSA